jgi:hypothetical protein
MPNLSQPIFDMSKAQPVDAPMFDMSKAQALGIGTPEWGLSQKAPMPAMPPAGLAARRNAMAQPGITPAMRSASPVNQGIETGLEAAPTVAGLMAAPVATAGAIAGGYLGGQGARWGAQELGAGEEGQDLAEAGGELVGGLGGGYGASKLPGGTTNLVNLTGKLARSIGAEGFANYFAEGPEGTYTPTDKMKQIQEIHEAIGVRPGDLDMGLGTTTLDDARNLQGKALLDAGIKPQDLQGLNPIEQAEKIKPIWQKAGEAVDATAAKATKDGVKLDVGKSLTDTIGNMLDPMGQQALDRTNDIAKQIGIEDWRKATPTQAVQLKRALWDGLPSRFRGPVYGAIARDLNEAVPAMKPVNQTYSEMRAVMDTLSDSQAKFMSRAGPTKFEQMLDLMKQHPIATSAVTGGAGAGIRELAEEGVSLYNAMRGNNR